MLPDPYNFASLCMHKYIPDVHVHVCPLLKILTTGVLLAWLHNIALYLGGGVNLLAEVKSKARQSGLGLLYSLSLYGVWELAPPSKYWWLKVHSHAYWGRANTYLKFSLVLYVCWCMLLCMPSEAYIQRSTQSFSEETREAAHYHCRLLSYWY